MWVLFGLLPAIAAVLVCVGVGGARWLAIALAIAICVPFAMADGWPGWFWRLDVQHGAPRPWMWWTVLLGGLLGTAYDFRLLPKVFTVGSEVVLVLMLPWFLSAELRAGWTFETCALYMTGGWLVMGLLWHSLRRVSKVQHGLPVPFAMTIALAVDAWLLRTHAGGPDWQLAGVAAVALGFAMLTTAWRRPFICGSGAALCLTLLHTGLLLCGRTERELLQLPLLLGWLAPLAMWIVVLQWFVKHRKVGACVGVLLVAGCGALAVWSA